MSYALDSWHMGRTATPFEAIFAFFFFNSIKRGSGDAIAINTKFGPLNETIRLKVQNAQNNEITSKRWITSRSCACVHGAGYVPRVTFFPFVCKYGENNGTVVRSNQLNAGLNNLTICFNLTIDEHTILPHVQQFRWQRTHSYSWTGTMPTLKLLVGGNDIICERIKRGTGGKSSHMCHSQNRMEGNRFGKALQCNFVAPSFMHKTCIENTFFLSVQRPCAVRSCFA